MEKAFMIRLNFDGACTPVNPGGVGTWGFTIDFCDGTPPLNAWGICDEGKPSTNNVAEYDGLVFGLREIVHRGITGQEIKIFGDSALVVNMVNGKWGRKNPHKKAPHLLPRLRNCESLLRGLVDRGNKIILAWVPRESNERADSLTKMAYQTYAEHTRK